MSREISQVRIVEQIGPLVGADACADFAFQTACSQAGQKDSPSSHSKGQNRLPLHSVHILAYRPVLSQVEADRSGSSISKEQAPGWNSTGVSPAAQVLHCALSVLVRFAHKVAFKKFIFDGRVYLPGLFHAIETCKQ